MAVGQVFCCNHCFTNEYLRDYIADNYEMTGKCPYCKSNNSYLISTKILGDYMRVCISKAYESYDEGTGAYHDEEEKQYCGPDGKAASIYSIREILTQNCKCQYKNVGFLRNKNVGFPTFLFWIF